LTAYVFQSNLRITLKRKALKVADPPKNKSANKKIESLRLGWQGSCSINAAFKEDESNVEEAAVVKKNLKIVGT
jgi:hypothetical protein